MDGVYEKLLNYCNELKTADLNDWWERVSADPDLDCYKDRTIAFCAFFALQTGRRDLLCLMLQNGFDPNSNNESGDPPIFYALAPIIETGFPTIWMLKDLISAGADVDVCRLDSMTPIIVAIEKNALAHLVVLLEAGADPWYVHHEDGVNSYEFCERSRKFNALNILREFS